jgi:trimethylamine--corrinoid protein Co-methyltransferase
MIEPIRALTEDQIEQIRNATEDLLCTVGFRVLHKDLLRLLGRAGARVDDTSGITRMPRTLLNELLAQAPPSYRIAKLDGTEYEIGGQSQHFTAIVTDPWVIDFNTQKPRRPRLEDIRRHTRIAQQLPPVVGISLMDFPVTDFDGHTSSLRAREVYVLTHGKHYLALPSSTEDLRRWLEIGDILAQGSGVPLGKLMSVAVAVIPPLVLAEANAEHLLLACQHDLPVFSTVCPSAGMTSPYSLASAVLQGNAETIFVCALSQLIKPGNPFRYGFGPSSVNLRTYGNMYYSVDKALWNIAQAQLGRSYNLPTYAECGGTLSARYDQQSGAEWMLFMLSAYASRANLLSSIGSCYNAVGMSAEAMVIQTAWLEVAKFLQRGINTDNEHLGLESLKRVGPSGEFLADDLTLRFLRSAEFFQCELFDLTAEGGEGEPMLVRAHKKAEELLSQYRCPVPEKVGEDVRQYFADLYKKLER